LPGAKSLGSSGVFSWAWAAPAASETISAAKSAVRLGVIMVPDMCIFLASKGMGSIKACDIIGVARTRKGLGRECSSRFGPKLEYDGPARHLGGETMTGHRVYKISLASVYPHYIAKAEKKGRTKAEVDEIIRWLTGHTQQSLDDELENKTSFEDFFARAPRLNPARSLITGVVCGIRVENIEEPLMRELRYLDKLVDELARGKAMEKILRA
jgi:hypothetical protein